MLPVLCSTGFRVIPRCRLELPDWTQVLKPDVPCSANTVWSTRRLSGNCQKPFSCAPGPLRYPGELSHTMSPSVDGFEAVSQDPGVGLRVPGYGHQRQQDGLHPQASCGPDHFICQSHSSHRVAFWGVPPSVLQRARTGQWRCFRASYLCDVAHGWIERILSGLFSVFGTYHGVSCGNTDTSCQQWRV